MNGITLTAVGNLTRDVDLRFTPSGQPVAGFTVAITPRTKRGDQWVDGETTFLDCQAWGLPAENIAETLTRGSRVLVTGTLKTERWQGKDGEDHERQRLTVDEIGPSLRYATARLSKTARQGTDQPAAAEGDPWATGGTADDYQAAVQTAQDQLGARAVPTEEPRSYRMAWMKPPATVQAEDPAF